MMADHRDRILIEHAHVQRARLGAALLSGRLEERRAVRDHAKSIVATIVTAALACAACVIVSFVTPVLAERTPASFPVPIGDETP